MGLESSFAFAQTRMQARFGERLTSSEWHRLRAIRDLSVLLQTLRGTSFERWVDGLAAHATVHEVELHLRAGWLNAVDEVAAWQPRPWRQATQWLRWLTYLPGLQKLARGGRAPGWMRTDPVLGPIVALEVQARAAAVASTDFAPLASGFGDTPDLARAWIGHWRDMWPTRSRLCQSERLIRELIEYREGLLSLPSSASSEESKATLERRLELIFRCNQMSATAAFSYLSLHALDTGKLRGTLAAQALREHGGSPP